MNATPQPPYRILVVCTANICRSVMAERLLRRELEVRGVSGVRVESCGLLFDGEPASDTVVELLDELGVDAADHRSRLCTPELLADADLVITMERGHARELTLAAEGASSRIHTFGALAAWLAAAEDLTGSPEDRVARCAADRNPGALLGSGTDEIEDPHGRSKRTHRKALERIERHCGDLLDGLF